MSASGPDWLAFSRACVSDLEDVLRALPTRDEREPVLRAGEGGDDTTAIDAAAEDVVVRRLEELGRDLTLVSEELGVRAFGAGGARLVRGEAGELDVDLVDRFGHDGLSYTPDASEALRRVEIGEADCAFLLRPPRVADVFGRAREGRTMPPKATYFFPKLLSGLLLHPLEP